MILDRWPDKTHISDKGAVTPIWQRWFTQLVIIVNGALVDVAALIVSVAANTAAIALLQPSYGSWTPVDVSGASLSFSSTEGRYVKIGRLVHLDCTLTYPVTASGAAALPGGFPFTVENTAMDLASASFGYTNSGLNLLGNAVNNSTALAIYNVAGAGAVTNAQLSNTTLRFSISYIATA